MTTSKSERLQQITAENERLADQFRTRIECAIAGWNGLAGFLVSTPAGFPKGIADQVVAEYSALDWDVRYRADITETEGELFYEFT